MAAWPDLNFPLLAAETEFFYTGRDYHEMRWTWMLLVAVLFFVGCSHYPSESYNPYPEYFGYQKGNQSYIPRPVVR